MKIKKLSKDVWQISCDVDLSSYIYLINKEEPILIDLGNKINYDLVIKILNLIGLKADDIKKIIYTHLHFDHIGRPSKFKNAKVYASKEEITSFKLAEKNTCLQNWEELEGIELNELPNKINSLEVIKTPGHTRGSVCLYLKEDEILFSGDTLFPDGHGRVDLPTSCPSKIESSLSKLKRYSYKTLAPGH